MSSSTVPAWLLLPLPANADPDPKLLAKVETVCSKLPDSFGELQRTLGEQQPFAAYEPAANRANALVWERLEEFLSHPDGTARKALIRYAADHLPERALARVLRRFAKDADMEVRKQVKAAIKKTKVREVALPAKKDGDWDASGWMLPDGHPKLVRRKTGRRVLEKTGVPVLKNLQQLRELLGIKSPNQLGYFLLASDSKDGPYTTYTIPKRDGSERKICAPKKQLKWVQRQILRHILVKVPPHPAAHGFINGRSTVSNAEPHVGAELVVKFDLKDFFPTVHYFRVMGLFASLGYPTGNCMFGTDDESNQIAPVLARLCCYTPEPSQWGAAALPQGAPERAHRAWRLVTGASGNPDFHAVLDFALENELVAGCEQTDRSEANVRWTNPTDGSEMVWIPPGKFRYGSDDTEVECGGFSLGRWPVTNEQFARFLTESGYEPSEFHAENGEFLKHWTNRKVPKGLARHPVVFASLFDAFAYCKWAGLTLPTEWQWEKAARGTDGRTYPWGDTAPAGSKTKLAHVAADGTCEVGKFGKVRSPYGCEDLIGNVSEWCYPLPEGTPPGPFPPPWPELALPTGSEGEQGVVRGACYLRGGYAAGKATYRRHLATTRRNKWTGFRVAAGLPCRPAG